MVVGALKRWRVDAAKLAGALSRLDDLEARGADTTGTTVTIAELVDRLTGDPAAPAARNPYWDTIREAERRLGRVTGPFG